MDHKFTENLAEGLRRFAMAGVGAVSVTVDKSKEIFDQLAEKGEAASAGSQETLNEMQSRLAAQLNAFAKKLKAECENASFEQLVEKCLSLPPEQKAQLIECLTAETDSDTEETQPDAAETETKSDAEEAESDETAESPADETEPEQ